MQKKGVLKIFFSLVALFLIVGGHSQETSQVLDEIQALNNEKNELMLSGRYDELARFYTENAISMPNYSKMLRGVDDIILYAKESEAGEYKVSEIKLKPAEIFRENSMLIETGEIVMKVSGPGIPGKVKEKGKYMTLWEKQADETWKIKAETWNVDVNPLDRIPGIKDKSKKRKKGKKD